MPIFVSHEQAKWASGVLCDVHKRNHKFPHHVCSRAMILWNEWKRQGGTTTLPPIV